MDCKREMIYFSDYENGVKTRNAGYAAVFLRGDICDVQMYYRGAGSESVGQLQPVYVFCDGTVVLGEKMELEEGMAAASFRTGAKDFVQSGRSLEELEVIYLDGVQNGICGGRPDGQGLKENAYTLTVGEEAADEKTVQHWTLQQYMERLPEMKLPFAGVCRQCRRLTLVDLEHLPVEWSFLRENNFLLHAYYEYHHALLVKFSMRNGERYAIGVPGEFSYRSRYMAENFGFCNFAPLNPGKCRGGCFGYWYYYLDAGDETI